MEDTQKKLDKALKRNLSEQQTKVTPVPSKTAPNDLSTEEPISVNDETDNIEE